MRGAVAPDAGRGFEKVAQRLRPAFQSALLGWIKGNDVGRHLDELLRVSIGLERAAATEQVKQLWTVIVAVLTAIRARRARSDRHAEAPCSARPTASSSA